MRYYVTSDVHGYFTELKAALTENGFFEDTAPHKLVICGDLFDRGSEALALQDFILDLLAKDQVILIRGNHEDLTMELLYGWTQCSYMFLHHHTNRTIDTVCQLTRRSPEEMYNDIEGTGRALLRTPYIQTIIPAMVDYFETEHYIFVHGWIPCTDAEGQFTRIPDWRDAGSTLWGKARWVNGMEAADNGITEPEKTIICGHWHTSFGHSLYENDGGEFENNPNFAPYYAPGIIAIDACTAFSHEVNCILLED